MPVDAVGSVLASTEASGSSSAIDQEDFIRLFLTELNYQDPLEPIDNREFLAQIAQFAALEQARTMGAGIDDLVFLTSGSQVFGILGKTVTITTDVGPVVGRVSSAAYTDEGPLLTIIASEGENVYTDIKLSQIKRVQ